MAEAVTALLPARVRLRRLAVRHFRNLARVELAPPPEGFAVVGDNGHGKTNLLEAIYYLQLQRSFRGARDQELVRFGEDGFHIAAEASGGRAARIAAGFERVGRRKKIVLDGREIPRLSDAIGALPSVIFSPSDVALVSGSPSERRHYLDVVLALTSRRYLTALQRYRAALANRNAALRQEGAGADLEGRVAVWEPALAEHGAVIWRERARWAAEYADQFADLCLAVGERGRTELRHATALESGDDPERWLTRALERRRKVDIVRGVTHAGPHRDDLTLTLDGREQRSFGSAGQQRTAAIALRLLEAATLRDRGATEPLILLDDPFAELDVGRAERILQLLTAGGGLGQIVLAVPRETDIPAELTRLERWTIRDGDVSR